MDKASILVVEDESIVALNMAHILKSLGYRVIGPAPTASRAMELVESERPALILMDIKLRGDVDGIQLAARIHTARRIPIVYVSTYTDDATLERAKLTEPYGYITKSFDDRELLSTIEMALYKHKMELQLVEKDELLATTLNGIADAVVTTDGRGFVRFMNAAARRLAARGESRRVPPSLDQLLVLTNEEGRRLLHPFSPTTIEPFLDGGRRALLNRAGRQSREVPVQVNASRFAPSGESIDGFVLVFRDLSDQVEAETTQAKLAAIVESSEDSIFSAGLDGTITSWNPGAEKMFGYSDAEARGRKLTLLTPPFMPDEMPLIIEKLKRGEVIDHYETVRLRKNGETVDVSLKASAIRDHIGTVRGISLIARDISARKKLDKRLLEMRNREQARIGRDLHDSLGQHLTGVLFRAKALELALEAKGVVDESRLTVELERLIKEAIAKTRELAAGLIPATLQSLGLKDAVQALCSSMGSFYGIQTHFRASERISVSDQVMVTELYHIAEEALTNASRHAGATAIDVSLMEDPAELVLTVRDDGRGFRGRRGHGLGLKIMDYRASSINARLVITDANGGGTLVECRLPITKIQAGSA